MAKVLKAYTLYVKTDFLFIINKQHSVEPKQRWDAMSGGR